MGIKDLAIGRADIFMIDPRELNVRPGWNSRAPEDADNKVHVMGLASSIAEVGVLEPLTVYLDQGKLYVSDGHCRLAATMIAIERGAEIKAVPVKTEGRNANEVDRVLSQIVRNSGKPLTPFEQGVVFKKLAGFGWPVAEIAAKSGKSPSHVQSCLDLQGAPLEVRQMVASGRVAASLATKVMKTEGAENAAAVLGNAIDAAKQEGKDHATARHIGSEPKSAKPNKLARVRELFENADVDPEWSFDHADKGDRVIVISEDEWRELSKLLDL